MNPSYEWLFYHYAAPFLEQQAAFDDGWLYAQPCRMPRLRLL